MTDLSTLHTRHLESLTGEAQLDYLLTCQDFLREEDVSGWKKRFAPDTTTETAPPQPPTKRRRMSPDAYIWTPYPPCQKCKSKDIIEDMREGSVVCTACGLIQSLQMVGVGAANMSYEQLKSGRNKTVHLYSRVVYFRSFLLGLQGLTNPSITQAELEALRVICAGVDFVDEGVVIKALKKMKKTTKYRRHRHSLACMINKGYTPVKIDTKHFFELLRLFRVIECHWQHGMKRKLHDRKVFFSYPYVFYQLCLHMGVMGYTGPHHLLKNRELLNKQHYAYGCIAKKAKMKFDVEVYRTK